MIILVCGGRDYSDRSRLFRELEALEVERGPIRGVIQGKASGADRLAEEWQRERICRQYRECYEARKRGHHAVPDRWMVGIAARWDDLTTPPVVLRYRRDGTPYNAAAGGIRNQQMLTWGPQVCVAFPGGRGTADMIGRARAAGVEVLEIV